VSSDDGYIVVEWTETDNSKNLAIFHIEDQKACVLSRSGFGLLQGESEVRSMSAQLAYVVYYQNT